MMHVRGKMDVMYHEEENFQVLAVPYVGNEVSMNIILPKNKTGLDTIVSDLKSGKLKMDSIKNPSMLLENMEIYVPRFKFDYTQGYNGILTDIGLGDMFSDKMADFSGITNEIPGLRVTSVIQKAFIEVKEEGTEAAAATCVACAGPKPTPVIFKADRPFIFLIVER